MEDKIAEVEKQTIPDMTATTRTTTTVKPGERMAHTETVETSKTTTGSVEGPAREGVDGISDVKTTVTTVVTETRTIKEAPEHKLMQVSQERRDSDLLEGVTHILEQRAVTKLIGQEGELRFFSLGGV